ncbi:hypothetical protein [Devosia sp. RR2S18]|uniref:hypothetical protein n=1 Tax=Devosia rhizosphaerae TaxID=3049774 RepID=UPI0025410C59|nr:hypothetical protein [Devosia sp. RR2S18]WIJ26526.1 hypothetical protein QOV41_07145 [Devosia sp. RR2S18]
MRFLASLALALALCLPAAAAPIPTFGSPKALLDAIYAQIEASEDWETYDADAAFDEIESFSARLMSLHTAANADVLPGDIGVLDFSPFIYGQDSGGMDFDVGAPKIKGDRAASTVQATGHENFSIRFELVDEGAAGWKVDDIILPGFDGGSEWRLSDYLRDPEAPL